MNVGCNLCTGPPKYCNLTEAVFPFRIDPEDDDYAFFRYRCGKCGREWETRGKLLPDT